MSETAKTCGDLEIQIERYPFVVSKFAFTSQAAEGSESGGEGDGEGGSEGGAEGGSNA